MPKRLSDERGGGREAGHLYLVLDDWTLGYSIRKIDLKAYKPRVGLLPLPTPIIQLEALPELPMYFGAAFGSKIIAMHPVQYVHDHGRTQLHVAPFFDVRMRALVYGPQPSELLSNPVFIPMGGKLFALCGQSLELLNLQEEPSGTWSWCKLLDLPFDSRFVTSYAVHPDGETIFVSIGRFVPEATYSFVVDSKGSVSTGHRDWMLPFQDRSYFVSELNAWIGLSRSDRIGYICAFEVVTAADSISHAPPLKFSKESVFTQNPAETHIGATLLYMGSKSEFCLVESIYVEEEDTHLHYLFRLVTFSLMYDDNEELTTGNTCRIWYYSVPEAISRITVEYPMAFYL